MSSRSAGDAAFSESGRVATEDLRHPDEHEGVGDRGKILFTASMGFFTDAYDLFIIGLVVVILKTQWG